MVISWLMILVGVVVTAIQTHNLSYNGMKGSKLYADWLEVATRREGYLCYLSASEWKQAKRGNLSSFVQIVLDKLAERTAKENADDEKLEELSSRVKALL